MIKCTIYKSYRTYLPPDIWFVLKKDAVLFVLWTNYIEICFRKVDIAYIHDAKHWAVDKTDSSTVIAALWRLYRVRGGE